MRYVISWFQYVEERNQTTRPFGSVVITNVTTTLNDISLCSFLTCALYLIKKVLFRTKILRMNGVLVMHLLRPARSAATRQWQLNPSRLYHPATGVFAGRSNNTKRFGSFASAGTHSNIMNRKVRRSLTLARLGSILGCFRLYSTSPGSLPPSPPNEVCPSAPSRSHLLR
jgi:hypothetical protein